MKASLKRIEATIHDLETRDISSNDEQSSSPKRSFSFRISVGAKEGYTAVDDILPSEEELFTPLHQQNLLPHNSSVQTFPAQENEGKTPILPKFKAPSFTSHRNAANPALAMNLLQEIQDKALCWQVELQKIIIKIQDLYIEGPIVNGWLESHEKEPEPKAAATATLRHGEVEHLIDYVEEICANGKKIAYQAPRAGYRLCGLNAAGEVWSRPCPPDQVASVSMAIARYQKLRQLLGRKQYLETRLTQLAESLVVLHTHIAEV
ncbi:hypothetical protein G7B40_002090 [Aetokthonos hydrillicola Thurmond2011]|jgi:hypothetical protein|uniref:Uncharacterized protein n=1 Tax=Aetokthonos hydrillicola Thurmond2011 TaxID=2712845 RepID=A0AAP5I1E2_9CYAN|nr:hypothetical protein [Aetokthonos hydrillicola]MBW4588063.1 hypothetical protein [Aetokthonos hydrillicola CCALA 1050]MDR9893378.1 hypothetical protein [Aetokthonos hydrillicola Thurmond2011]